MLAESAAPGALTASRRESALKIGFYSPSEPDSGSANGIVTYTRLMRNALRSLGHSVVVVTDHTIEHPNGSISKLPKIEGILAPLQILWERRHGDRDYARSRLILLQAFHAARRAGVEIFEVEESFGLAGRLAGYGIPIVERLHGPHALGREPMETIEEKTSGDLRAQAEINSMEKVQAVTCPSRRLLEEMMLRYSPKVSMSEVIPNPIGAIPNNAAWNFRDVEPEQILCVGRIDLRKGADIVMRAFSLALDRRPTLSLIMAGPDSGIKQRDGTILKFAEFASIELAPQVRDRIQFLGPQRPGRLIDLRRKSALSVVGSRFENFAYSVAEAMASGMPVLASDSFGNAEMIRDAIDGRIVPIADVEAMADAMIAMVGNPADLISMGQSARLRAEVWLDPERIAKQTVAFYHNVLSANGS